MERHIMSKEDVSFLKGIGIGSILALAIAAGCALLCPGTPAIMIIMVIAALAVVVTFIILTVHRMAVSSNLNYLIEYTVNNYCGGNPKKSVFHKDRHGYPVCAISDNYVQLTCFREDGTSETRRFSGHNSQADIDAMIKEFYS